jgi:hypothetical protein
MRWIGWIRKNSRSDLARGRHASAETARQAGCGRAPAACEDRVISDCHPSEGAAKKRTHMPIIHRFYLFSALPSLG